MRHLLLILLFPLSIAAQPSIYEPNVLSDGGAFGFTLSPKGDNALWVRSYGGRDTLVIMEAVKRNGRWQKPVPAIFSNKPGIWKDIDPVFTPDGKMILFQSDRPVEGQPDKKDFDIWAVKKMKDDWGPAFHLGNVINTTESESFASMAKNGNIYFMKSNGSNSSDIFVSKKVKGGYQTPENIGSVINTQERESNPFISPKEDYLLFFSTNPKGNGEADLYISYQKNGVWTEPKNLGQPINSAQAEFCPFYHQPTSTLFFARQKKNGKRFTEDIYSYPFKIKKEK